MKFPYGLSDFGSLIQENYFYAVVALGLERVVFESV